MVSPAVVVVLELPEGLGAPHQPRLPHGLAHLGAGLPVTASPERVAVRGAALVTRTVSVSVPLPVLSGPPSPASATSWARSSSAMLGERPQKAVEDRSLARRPAAVPRRLGVWGTATAPCWSVLATRGREEARLRGGVAEREGLTTWGPEGARGSVSPPVQRGLEADGRPHEHRHRWSSSSRLKVGRCGGNATSSHRSGRDGTRQSPRDLIGAAHFFLPRISRSCQNLGQLTSYSFP